MEYELEKTQHLTPRQKMINKLLLLYVVQEMNKTGEEITEEKLMARIWAIQKHMEANGIETFSYKDWEWKE